MSFPRSVYLEELVGSNAHYVDEAKWRVFRDVDHHFNGGVNVLIQLGDRYTIIAAEEFIRTAARILKQAEP